MYFNNCLQGNKMYSKIEMHELLLSVKSLCSNQSILCKNNMCTSELTMFYLKKKVLGYISQYAISVFDKGLK